MHDTFSDLNTRQNEIINIEFDDMDKRDITRPPKVFMGLISLVILMGLGLTVALIYGVVYLILSAI